MPAKADYGIDAPGVVRNLLVIGAGLVFLGFFLPPFQIGQARIVLNRALFWTGGLLLLEGVLMLVYAKFGKFRHRDRMLNMVSWRGDEQVLDVGTGRGLLAIGAAMRLTTGRAIGVDIWSAKDLSGNSLEMAESNIAAERVQEKVALRSEDARRLGFADDAFDIVVSNLCIHNIPGRSGREQACQEIARVLKPGGTALISDFKNTGDYQRILAGAGLRVSRTWFSLDFPPLRIVKAVKVRYPLN